MKHMHGIALLPLVMFVFASPAIAAGKDASASISASGAITPAPSSNVGASASAASSSSPTSAPLPVPTATAASASASVPVGTSAAEASSPATPAATASAASMSASAASSASAPVAASTSTSAPASAEAAPFVPKWKIGPREIALLDQAKLKLPQEYAYLEQDDARKLLRKLGNANPDDVMGLLSGPGGNWLVVVRFVKSGYIKDSAATAWKPDALLETLKTNAEQTNETLKKNGGAEAEIIGWLEPPSYDTAKHRLIWAVFMKNKDGKDNDFQSANYNVYLLGREGYFNFSLASDLVSIDQNKKYAGILVSGVAFNEGKGYSDFKSTDKVSTYALTALVNGTDKPGVAVKKEKVDDQAQKQSGSKFAKFMKVFAMIMLAALLLLGIAAGAFFMMKKKRAAKLAEEVAAMEAPKSKE
jgi:uncharacterized membrane-anchored protein